MRNLLLPRRAMVRAPARAVEATPAQVAAVGASGSGMYGDPLDEDRGWKPAGSRGREVPYWTQEKARTYSIAAYRVQPMAKAIIDTYTSFCVGDTGVKLLTTNAKVGEVANQFWTDPINNLPGTQELGLRSMMLLGETLRRLMVGPTTGVVRYGPIDPALVTDVWDKDNNPAWPEAVLFGAGDTEDALTVARADEITGLRDGEAMWWTPWKAIETDQRSQPFLSTVLDWLDSYDQVLSNLVDRTALMRYFVWDVTVEGGQTEVDAFVAQRKGTHVPQSGTVEVHNSNVKWEPKTAETGAYEDANASKSILTLAAAGSGLSKVWLAEPEDANRATSLSMAEPVRRRVQGVQKQWLWYQAEMVKFAVDRAVAAHRLPATVDSVDPKTGETKQVNAADTVIVSGPEVAAADSQITAKVLLNLSTGLEKLVKIGALTAEASQVAARKAWEDYMGIPYHADLGKPDSNPDDIAEEAEKAAAKPDLRAV